MRAVGERARAGQSVGATEWELSAPVETESDMRSRGLKVVKQGSEAMPGKSSARESGRASGGGLARDKAVQ